MIAPLRGTISKNLRFNQKKSKLAITTFIRIFFTSFLLQEYFKTTSSIIAKK